jgi:hypothetical protein
MQKVNELNSDMKNELDKYVNDEVVYRHIQNFTHEKMDFYEILGRYAYKNIILPKELNFFYEYLDSKHNVDNMEYNSLAISLLTHQDFVIDKLKELYGEPIYHDEFGEGFPSENDEEPEIKESCASYFITIEGVDLHVNYDQTGMAIEAKKGTTVLNLIEALKKFIYICYKK